MRGQRSIEHLRDEIEPFCTPATASACDTVIAAFLANDTWQVPTLTALRSKGLADTGLVHDPLLRYIPASLRADWLSQNDARLRRGQEYLAGKRARFRDELWLVGLLNQPRRCHPGRHRCGSRLLLPGIQPA